MTSRNIAMHLAIRCGHVSRTDPRTVRTTAAVLDAAEQLFRERGFHDATMDEIAERAGVAVGSIYFHFGNKETLHLALVERALDVNERYMAAAYGDGRSALEEVLAAGDAYLRFHLEHPGYFRMIALAPEVNPAEGQRQIADRVERLVAAVGDALARAAAAGELVVDSPQDAAVFLGAPGTASSRCTSGRIDWDSTRSGWSRSSSLASASSPKAWPRDSSCSSVQNMPRVAAVQLEVVVAEVDANLAACERLADAAGAAGAEVIALPEFFTTGIGFLPELAACALAPDGAATQLLRDLARRHGALVGGSFLGRDDDGHVRNAYMLATA